jgi:nucleotide-binding universal stress UspA family protein
MARGSDEPDHRDHHRGEQTAHQHDNRDDPGPRHAGIVCARNPAEEEALLFQSIVVGTDGSDTAAEAVRQATELARLTNAQLHIVSAYEPVPQHRLQEESQEVPGDIAYAVGPREDVNVVLEAAMGPAQSAGIQVQPHPREGDPADAILDVAEEKNASLIVVGNKGMTGARRFLLGSVPNKISHHAPCGVYIVRTT